MLHGVRAGRPEAGQERQVSPVQQAFRQAGLRQLCCQGGGGGGSTHGTRTRTRTRTHTRARARARARTRRGGGGGSGGSGGSGSGGGGRLQRWRRGAVVAGAAGAASL